MQEALIQAASTCLDPPAADLKGSAGHGRLAESLDAAAAPRSRVATASSGSRPSRRPDRPRQQTTRRSCSPCGAHPSLTPASAVAQTLRAVGGLIIRQIAQAYLVPEATMAQRISRATRTVGDVLFEAPGDLVTVSSAPDLVFNEGYTGDVDLAAEAIRLTDRWRRSTEDQETVGPLASMLLHHARRPARTRRDGSLAPPGRAGPLPLEHLADRRGRRSPADSAGSRPTRPVPSPGRVIAALHADAPRTEETDGPRSSAATTSCSVSRTA